MKSLKQLGFTLTELIIAIAISALVLIVIFNFVADTVAQLSDTNKNTRFLGDFARYTSRLNSHSSTFGSGSILIDQSETTGHDVLLFTNLEGTNAVLWGVVDADTYRLLPNSEYLAYTNAVMGYRLISSIELADILATPANVYNYTFFGDKMFHDFKVYRFQAEFYNSDTIMSIDMSVVKAFALDKVGIPWLRLPRDDLFEVNLNF